MEISIQDLLIAYRKTKVDMFYSGLPCRAKLLEFEKQLENNILTIKDWLERKDEQALLSLCHGYLLVPKKIKLRKRTPGKLDDERVFEAGDFFSNPSLDIREDQIESCELRPVVDAPVAFHVITTWWILKIGEKLERSLSPNSYGNRIRRHENGEVSQYSTGTFKWYMKQYQDWRDNGLKAMRGSLERGKDIVAITADFSAFFHNLDASFLSSDRFYAIWGKKQPLSREEREYTDLIVGMLQHWPSSTSLVRGLPVECAVSAVLANLVLRYFDSQIEKEVIPVYYGRYVDDVIIVLENPGCFAKSQDVWQWLAKRIDGLEMDLKGGRVLYHLPDIFPGKNRTLVFEADKTRQFFLDHDAGGMMLDSLERQIREKSSEWRALPVFPDNKSEMVAKTLTACDSSGEEADALRKVNALSWKRAVFALRLRDFESYARNLPSDGWRPIRLDFLELIDKQFTDIKSFFELHKYFPRIVTVAFHCGGMADKEERKLLLSIIDKWFQALDILEKLAICVSGGHGITPEAEKGGLVQAVRTYFSRTLVEHICSSTDAWPDNGNLPAQLTKLLLANGLTVPGMKWQDLYSHDLAFQPARMAYQPYLGAALQGIGLHPERFAYRDAFLPTDWRDSIHAFASLYQTVHPSQGKLIDNLGSDISLVFPIRPLNTVDLTEMFWNPFGEFERGSLSKFLVFQRGYGLSDDVFPVFREEDDGPSARPAGPSATDVEWSGMEAVVNVALANWNTDDDSYNASVCRTNDPNAVDRYNRLMSLVNGVLASGVKVHYLVFPELAIPPEWFAQIALKLKASRISLIAGVEYLHEADSKVRNQVWCSLLNDGCGFPLVSVFKFEKAYPAIHEAEELWMRGKLNLTSRVLEGGQVPLSVVRHGNNLQGKSFDFSVLICSDFTNVEFRSQLRGKIDALIIPSWNQDEETFSSLVESAAYDVHAYIIQCNNRPLGDTRIRAPAKKRHERDIVKIKGGEKDYFVIGRLDIEKLRRFQSFPISPSNDETASFKPVPIGFAITDSRRILPQ